MRRTILTTILSQFFLFSIAQTISEAKFAQIEDNYNNVLDLFNKGIDLPISKRLHPIIETDEYGMVEMIAWKSKTAAFNYYAQPGKQDTLDSKYLTWVFTKSEFLKKAPKHKLTKLTGEKLAIRMDQLLGLPPSLSDTSRYFVEFKVRATDLFRPCKDPEINDCECSKSFANNAYSPPSAAYSGVYWSVAESTEGFPWTSLGYTYNWNKKSKKHFGMSEYIIQKDAVVTIVSKTATEAWLKKIP